MTPEDFRSFCRVMQEFGVTHLTMDGCDIVRENNSVPKKLEAVEDKSVDIQHKIEEVKSVMQLGDEELLNRMFPEETEDQSSVN